VRPAVLILLAGCLPADTSPATPAAADPIVHTWKVMDHVVTGKAAIGDADAREMHGRTIEITVAGYTSPWQGTCADASRQSRHRSFAEIATDLDVPAPGRTHAEGFGLADQLVEYRLSCGTIRSPPLTIYIAGDHAMTCANGICYLLVVAR